MNPRLRLLLVGYVVVGVVVLTVGLVVGSDFAQLGGLLLVVMAFVFWAGPYIKGER